MKKIVLYLTLTASSTALAMLEEIHEAWGFEVQLTNQVTKKLVFEEIKKAYNDNPPLMCWAMQQRYFLRLEDSRENIVKKLHVHPWFYEKTLYCDVPNIAVQPLKAPSKQ